MANKAIKEQAQQNLLLGMQVAFEHSVDEKMRAEMSKQMARVEKMFGFEPYSFERGC